MRTPLRKAREMSNVVSMSMSQKQAEEIAQQHVDLARSVVGWFGFDRRKEIVWGPDYNQAARDIYVKACLLIGVDPIDDGASRGMF